MPEYDIFEIFPDGSFQWRVFVCGTYNKERKLQELSEASENRFYAVNIAAGETLPLGMIMQRSPRHATRSKKAGLKETA